MSIPQKLMFLALSTGLFLLPNQAVAQEDPWAVRVAAASARGLVSSSFGDPGLGVGLEYRASRRVGVELQSVRTEVANELFFGFVCIEGCSFETRFDLGATMAKLNWYLTPGRAVEMRVAPVLSYLAFDNYAPRRGTSLLTVELEDAVAWGLNIGFDAAFGKRSSFATADLTFLDSPFEIAGLDDKSSMQALVLSAGVGLRF